jgi:hypothetical protein
MESTFRYSEQSSRSQAINSKVWDFCKQPKPDIRTQRLSSATQLVAFAATTCQSHTNTLLLMEAN